MTYSPTKEFGEAPVEKSSPIKKFAFHCRDYGDFQTEPSRYGFFSITEGCAGKRRDTFEVKEILMLNPKEKIILIVQPYSMSLTEFLGGCPISERKVHRFGSVVEHPTEIVKSVIQGIVTVVFNLNKSKKSHSYLLNTDNLVLQFEDYEPYSRYVCDRTTKTYDMFEDLVNAGYNVAPRVHVHLVHIKEDENKMDDSEALWKLIFNVILQVDDNNASLPSEWLHFYDLFFHTPLNYELISCHSCMWGTNKRIRFYRSLNDLYYKSSDSIHFKVHSLLRSLMILKTDWLSLVDGDYVLMKIRDRAKRPYVSYYVSSLISYFRNVVEHADEVAKTLTIAEEGSQYSDLRYLDYRLDLLFPNLLIELHSSLLSIGYVY
ncbi:hypothetical protein POM88_034680 [Heracleum sosnowskyi]|uniref:Uncharacterized protein n=1 Tax=Heracleum sosnowskyi TaxID=360622 RepID=A0AAD8HKS8_9APIA|nr:hypothetical protein POM88_034680 [Heracleum sosnowskyi]